MNSDDTQEQMHQLMLERMQMLEEALERAEAGVATGADWDIIRYECGMPKKQTVKLETISIARSE
jgi:hypothetical protein